MQAWLDSQDKPFDVDKDTELYNELLGHFNIFAFIRSRLQPEQGDDFSFFGDDLIASFGEFLEAPASTINKMVKMIADESELGELKPVEAMTDEEIAEAKKDDSPLE